MSDANTCQHNKLLSEICDDCIAESEAELVRNNFYRGQMKTLQDELTAREQRLLKEAEEKGYNKGLRDAGFIDPELMDRMGKALQKLLVKIGAIQDVELTFSTLATLAEDYKPKHRSCVTHASSTGAYLADGSKLILESASNGVVSLVHKQQATVTTAQTDKSGTDLMGETLDKIADLLHLKSPRTMTDMVEHVRMMKEALQFYANDKNYVVPGFRMESAVDEDRGRKAFSALETSKRVSQYRGFLVDVLPYLEAFSKQCKCESIYSCVHSDVRELREKIFKSL
jgi:hypothetical protein